MTEWVDSVDTLDEVIEVSFFHVSEGKGRHVQGMHWTLQPLYCILTLRLTGPVKEFMQAEMKKGIIRGATRSQGKGSKWPS